MSNIRVLRSSWEGSAWKIAFSDCLILLRPDINPDAIDEIADSELILARQTDPVLAAQRWAGEPLAIPPEGSHVQSVA
jgi:hypothetical protein